MSTPAKKSSTEAKEKDLMFGKVQVFKSWLQWSKRYRIQIFCHKYDCYLNAFKLFAEKVPFKKRNAQLVFMIIDITSSASRRPSIIVLFLNCFTSCGLF